MTTQASDQARSQAFSQRMLGTLNEAALALMTAIGILGPFGHTVPGRPGRRC